MHAQSDLDLHPGNKHRPERYSRAIPKVYDVGFDEIEFPTQRRKRRELEEKMKRELNTCPDCGRLKAGGVKDCAAGLCPKWWAVRDPDAEKDCARVKAANAKPKNLEQAVLAKLGPAIA